MYMVCTWNWIEFVFNNQTVFILLLLVKTVCEIDLLPFTKYCGALKLLKPKSGKVRQTDCRAQI